MSDEKEEKEQTEYAEFIFPEEEIQQMQDELMDWAEERNMSETELCIVLGILYEFLKEELGFNPTDQIKITSGEIH